MTLVSIVAALSQIVAGLRLGLILFAVMSLLAGTHDGDETPVDRLRRRGATLLALGILFASPAHTAWLLGRPLPPIVSRSMDLVGSAFACECLILLFAGRALKRGLSEARVRRGMVVNHVVLLILVGVACRIR